jgi:hypothetical protein
MAAISSEGRKPLKNKIRVSNPPCLGEGTGGNFEGGIMSGFDILDLVGEPWNDSASVFGGIEVAVTDVASLPTSKFLEFVLNGASIYRVLKTGETIISDATGTSLGGIKLAGSAGEMALTSQTDPTTSAPAEALRYSWEDALHVGTDPASGSVLQGMGASNFSIEGAAKITHIAGSSAYAWSGILGTRLSWTGNTAATNDGRTIDFTNVGQTNRASPIVSVSAANAADDLIQFGLSDGTNWTVAAKIDAAGRGQFQMVDLPEQGAPGNPAATTARIYGTNVNGATKVAFRDSSGAETVLGSTISVSGGTVTSSSPLASFTQTWNATNVSFSAIAATITDTQSSANSTLINLTVNADPVFQVRKSGETLIHNSTGAPWLTLSADLDDHASPGNLRGVFRGIVANWNRNNVGGLPQPMLQLKTENAPFFEITPNTVDVSENGGRGSMMLLFDKVAGRSKSIGLEHQTGSGGQLVIDNYPALFMNWGGGAVGETLFWQFTGSNRTHFRSDAAFVHETLSGRFEWETGADGRISFVGFRGASSIGRTIDFNNFGQSPTSANPVVSISVEHQSDDALHIGTLTNSGAYLSLARFDGTGALHAPDIALSGVTGTAPALTVRLDSDANDRASIGLDASDRGAIKLGIGGTTAPDVMLSRGPFAGCLDISNGTAPTQIRIYRTYGADAEFWNMTWRLTSPPWASIRTNFSGAGAARNICIEPTLLGLGIPVGNGSNIPALKRVATQIQVRLGDDSDFTSIRGKLTTADSAVPELVLPTTHTLILYDANGTAYKVPCVPA